MSAVNYLYLDDDDQIEGIIGAIIEDGNDVSIEYKHPSAYNNVAELIASLNDYNGLILDWQLNLIAKDGEQPSNFYAGAIAQEVRTRSTEQSIKPLPIVLWSTDEKLSKSYYGDETGHDLFDQRHNKAKLGRDTEYLTQTRLQLQALVDGYSYIGTHCFPTSENLARILGLPQEQFEELDIRFRTHFPSQQLIPVHRYARFVLKQVIERPSVLIDENLLAARLGIAKEQSADWQNLLARLPEEAQYKGAFHQAWPRWWRHIVEDEWWEEVSADLEEWQPLTSLEAAERVEIIRAVTELDNLKPADPIDPNYDTRFDTICEFNKKPLDTINGIFIEEPDPASWQDHRYISLDTALERLGENQAHNLYPHPIKSDYLSLIRKMRSSEDAE